MEEEASFEIIEQQVYDLMTQVIKAYIHSGVAYDENGEFRELVLVPSTEGLFYEPRAIYLGLNDAVEPQFTSDAGYYVKPGLGPVLNDYAELTAPKVQQAATEYYTLLEKISQEPVDETYWELDAKAYELYEKARNQYVQEHVIDLVTGLKEALQNKLKELNPAV